MAKLFAKDDARSSLVECWEPPGTSANAHVLQRKGMKTPLNFDDPYQICGRRTPNTGSKANTARMGTALRNIAAPDDSSTHVSFLVVGFVFPQAPTSSPRLVAASHRLPGAGFHPVAA